MYRVLADATMVLHFAFLVYLTLGGFVAWRWPRTIIAHLIAVAWGALIVIFEFDCPLTGPEDYFRKQAGQEGLPGGFIDTYLTDVVYPAEHVDLVRLAVAVVVAVSWAGFVVRLRARRRARLSR
ncbi:DUF2784 domain-containing protein [Haloechinothrix halophila]|uniref:DUF2784 domain-containing protein n=1 Tax=Haloechinothrix halophila TaxID=1069073 RepID=UPI00042869C9|nr:DUF2784 domain-containing protein [Haloechinothrix halophila]